MQDLGKQEKGRLVQLPTELIKVSKVVLGKPTYDNV